MELQIFQQFIEERLDMLNTGTGISDEFEIETVRYSEKMGKRKPYKEFFKNVKDKVSSVRVSLIVFVPWLIVNMYNDLLIDEQTLYCLAN